jgi:4-amino-4-deoxy-L-arabinose transferase-like glycosyltransferase
VTATVATLALKEQTDGTPSTSGEIPETLAGRRRIEFGVALLSAVTNLWNLSVQGWGNTYYAASVRSMTQGLSNWFFASYDPGGWVTVDKPPLAWWIPAAAAKVFGFNSWTVLGPSAVAGATAVLLLTVTVRRVWGPSAGIISGVALAVMPAAVAVSRSNNPDVWLVLGVVAAAWAMERAVATARWRWILMMGLFVGVGFLAKLGAALIVVPALWMAYFVGASSSWKKRLVELAAATAALVAVALIWVSSTALVPAASRPFIGGSTDGTAWDLLVGYNGLGRITGNEGTGAGPPGGTRGGAGFGRTGGVNSFGGSPGIGRLFHAGTGDQIMWLIVPAVAAALGATWLLVRRRLDRKEVASLVAFGGWLATTFVVFSFAKGVFHNYYVSLLAPAIAALVGIGAALLLRAGRRGALFAAGTLLGTAVVQLVLLRRIDEVTALRVIVPVALLGAAVALVLRRRGIRAGLVTLVAAVGASMIAPAAWSVTSLGHTSSGSFPEARPISLEMNPGGAGSNRGAAPSGGGFGGGLDSNQLTWLRLQRNEATWIVAVSSSMQASSAIISGDSVMAIGGFSGGDPTLTTSTLADLVRSGSLRFVAAGGGFPGGGSRGGTGVTTAVSAVCVNVPPATWGGTGTSALYDCVGKADALAAYVAPATTNSSAAGGGAAGVDFEAIQACMTDKGIDLAGPGAGQPDDATMKALQECGLPLPADSAPAN